jgi:hypothetical protein
MKRKRKSENKIDMPFVFSFLNSVWHAPRERESKLVQKFLQSEKQRFVFENDQKSAKVIWCTEQILRSQDLFREAFFHMKSEDFYSAWCALERAEIELFFLSKHVNFQKSEFAINFMETWIPKFQSLFPYQIFASSEIISLEKECSVCKKIVNIRNPCGHIPGEIYNGEQCYRIVTEAKLVGISMVTNPSNKYSVSFLTDENGDKRDHYDYSIIKTLVGKLESPFTAWDYEKTTKFYPNTTFKDLGPEESCPCGLDLPYGECCRNKMGISMPHIQFYIPGLNEASGPDTILFRRPISPTSSE